MRFDTLSQALRLSALALFTLFLASCGVVDEGDGEQQIIDPLFAACQGCPIGGGNPNEPRTSAPVPGVPAANVISIYSDAYSDIGGVDYNPNWGQATVYATQLIGGDNTIVYSGLNYQGIDFAGNPQDISAMTTLHIDFWTANSTLLNVYLISTGPVEAGYTLPKTQGAWVSVDIPLTDFAGVDLADIIQMKFDGNGTIYVDNIYFHGGGGGATAPTTAAPTPTTPAGDVTSVFSDAYTDIAGVDFNPDWGQSTVYSLESIAGNDTLKYAGLTYQGIDFAGNAQDVSGHDMIHLDVWTPDATAVNFYLISPGPVETGVALPISAGTWVSVDIPLSDFNPVDLAAVIQMKFDDATTGEAATIFVDNIYFYSSAPATAPTTAAPTPTTPAGDVTSVFSDAYTDIAGVDFNPDWGQSTVYSLESIAGNDTLKYAGLTYQGIDFAGNAQDVSGHDMIHLDVWTPDASAVNFYLISPGPVETGVALPISAGTWVSVDIPLSDFNPVDLADVIQMKFDDATTGEAATIFVDNIYFYSSAPATAPTTAAPTPTTPAGDVTSVFSDAYTDIAGVDFNPAWGQSTVYSLESIAGNDTLKYAGLTFQGIDLNGSQNVSAHDTLHLDFWTPDATAVNLYLISSGPVETAVALPITNGTWVSVDIPLSNFTGVDLADVIQMKFDDATTGEAATIFIDNLYFYSSTPATAPTTAAPAPTTPAGDVTSVFSDAYTDIAGVDFNPDWGQSTVYSLESIAGNDTLKYAGLTYQGIDFAGNAQDVSGHDMIHLDVWTPDASAVNFYLISSGPSETGVALPITNGTWVSVDIPLSDFTAVNLADVIQFKFDDATTGEAATIFVDNLYFYSSGSNSANLTTNGDFEAGNTSGWEFFPNDGAFAASMAQSNGGAWSGNLVASVPGGGGPPSFPVIKQANIGIGTVTPDSDAYISFDLFGSVAGAGGVFFAEFFSELTGGGTSSAVLLGGGPLFPTGTWTTYTFTTTTGNDVTGGVTLQLKADCGGNPGCTVDAFIDNVCVAATPGVCF